jgi:hypothetical protein
MVWSMVLLGILNTSANPTAPRPIDSYCTGKLGESSFAAKTPTSNRCKLLTKFRNNCVNEPSFVPATVGTLAETVELVAGWNWLWSHGLQRPGSCQYSYSLHNSVAMVITIDWGSLSVIRAPHLIAVVYWDEDWVLEGSVGTLPFLLTPDRIS